MFSCCGSRSIIYSDQLPPTPSDQEAVEQACEIREVLSTNGVIVRRLNSKLELAEKKVELLPDGSGIEYTPASKAKRQFLLFTDLCDVSIEDPNTKLYRKANLNPQKDVIVNYRTRSGTQWRLVYESLAEAQRWLVFIGYERSTTYNAKSAEDTVEGRIQSLFHRADGDHNGKLSYHEAKKLMVALNVNMDKRTLKTVFKKFDTTGDGELDINEFTMLFKILTDRPELHSVLNKFAKNPSLGVSRDEFREFCKYQKESESFGDVVFRSLEPNREGYINFSTFVNFLLDSNVNGIMMSKHKACVVDDMTYSLKDYFINSSHNTYLSGNQLSSGSTVEMYKMALRAGCRCVELDCWDGPKNDPVIYHGHTRTSKIRFIDALKTINRYAFQNSPYPVILSLEVHTSESQTDKLAYYLTHVFGPLLLKANELVEGKYSPEGLKYRVIVKGKRKSVNPIEDDDDGEKGEREELPGNRLADCLGMTSVHSEDWGLSNKEFHVQSKSENKIDGMTPEFKEKFTLQNTRMITRIYPKGSRITSSNYNPALAWGVGAQLVALNYQTWDEGMRLNDGLFLQNSRCGYVLKPLYLRDPNNAKPTPYTLNFRVICGSQIPKPNLEKKGDIVDPYVMVLINGGDAFSGRTTTVMNNGLKPHWDEEFVFSGKSFELDVLSVRVMDEDSTSADDEVCEISFPVKCLRQGFRALSLKMCDTGLRAQGASLLCHCVVTPHPIAGAQ